MKINSTYEHIAAHFLPGIITTTALALLLFPTSEILKLPTNFAFVSLFSVFSLFVGILQDSIIFTLLDFFFSSSNEDTLPMISDEHKLQIYLQILKESHYYFEFCFNSIASILILSIAYFFRSDDYSYLVGFVAFILIVFLYLAGTNYRKRRNNALNALRGTQQ